jgi:hypothetical protein
MNFERCSDDCKAHGVMTVNDEAGTFYDQKPCRSNGYQSRYFVKCEECTRRYQEALKVERGPMKGDSIAPMNPFAHAVKHGLVKGE